MIIRKSSTRKLLIYMLAGIFLITSVPTYLFFTKDASAAVNITFPIIGNASYSDDFNAPRSNGPHHATDIIASKHQRIVSASDGVITHVAYPEPSWGYAVFIRDSNGYEYNYLHMNNDTPGTDNGKGGGMNAYAPDIERGNVVKKGQLLGYVGDSGNAEETVSHLHFEIISPNGNPGNPYQSLNQAKRISRPVVPPALAGELLPFGIGARIGMSIDDGNFDLDADTETVVGAGKDGGPQVKVFDKNNALLRSFFAYNIENRNGIDVASGDIDGDGRDEIITGTGKGSGAHVKIFSATGQAIGGFFAYPTSNRDGFRVTTGDVDGDGTDEIITAPNSGSGPHVKVFNAQGVNLYGFMAYANNYREGVDVAAGDMDNDGSDEIVTGTGYGAAPLVKVFEKEGTNTSGFFAYDRGFRGGVMVNTANRKTNDLKEEIVTIPASIGAPEVRIFETNGQFYRSNLFLEEWWRGPYDIAASNTSLSAAAGVNRRVTIRPGL